MESSITTLNVEKLAGNEPDFKMSQRQKFRAWMDHITNESSMHGLAWYNRTNNRCLKFLLVSLTFTAIILVPILVAVATYNWTKNEQVTINEERRGETSMVYPPLVLCHPKFFNVTKMQGTVPVNIVIKLCKKQLM